MKVKHTVLFNFKEDAGEAQVQDALDTLNRLPKIISEIQEWEIAEDQGRRKSSFRFALLATFADMDAMERYLIHPEHESAVAKAAPLLNQVAEHDYVIQA